MNEKVEKVRMKKAEEKSSWLKYVIYVKIYMKKIWHSLKLNKDVDTPIHLYH